MKLSEADIPGLLAKLRAQLLFSQPFFSILLLNMNLVPSDDPDLDVMCTDGESVFYNPKGVLELKDDKTLGDPPDLDLLKSVLCHEGMHPALLHHTRRGDRDFGLWNQAGDHAINNILADSGMRVGTNWLCNPSFKGWTAEQIYAALSQQKQQQQGQQQGKGGGGGQQQGQQQGKGGKQDKKQGQGKGSGAGQQGQGKGGGAGQQGPQQSIPKTEGGVGQVIDAPKGKRETQEQDWQTALQQAAVASRAAGKMPAGMERVVQAAKQPALNWRELTRRFLSETMFADFRWSRPNRRLMGEGFYLPSAIKEGLGYLAYAIDCSGSIWYDREMVEQFASEVRSVHEELKPERTSVIYFDTVVSRTEEFTPSDQIEFHPKGGGGTDFRPLFDFIEQQDVKPKCLIVLTDLIGPTPDMAPDYPVLWACNTPKEGPFGETVHFH